MGCICGPSGRGNTLGQLYIPWPQAVFVNWFSHLSWIICTIELKTSNRLIRNKQCFKTCTNTTTASLNACSVFLPCPRACTVHAGSVCAKLK